MAGVPAIAAGILWVLLLYIERESLYAHRPPDSNVLILLTGACVMAGLVDLYGSGKSRWTVTDKELDSRIVRGLRGRLTAVGVAHTLSGSIRFLCEIAQVIRKAFRMSVEPERQGKYVRRHNPIWRDLAETLLAHAVRSRWAMRLVTAPRAL